MNPERPVADPAILKRGRAAEDMPPFTANEKNELHAFHTF